MRFGVITRNQNKEKKQNYVEWILISLKSTLKAEDN